MRIFFLNMLDLSTDVGFITEVENRKSKCASRDRLYFTIGSGLLLVEKD